jgi:hypothetical protein
VVKVASKVSRRGLRLFRTGSSRVSVIDTTPVVGVVQAAAFADTDASQARTKRLSGIASRAWPWGCQQSSNDAGTLDAHGSEAVQPDHKCEAPDQATASTRWQEQLRDRLQAGTAMPRSSDRADAAGGKLKAAIQVEHTIDRTLQGPQLPTLQLPPPRLVKCQLAAPQSLPSAMPPGRQDFTSAQEDDCEHRPSANLLGQGHERGTLPHTHDAERAQVIVKRKRGLI